MNTYDNLGEFYDFNVLILDNDEQFTQYISSLLTHMHISHYVTKNLTEAENTINKINIDCALVDIQLDDDYGFNIYKFFDPEKCIIISGYIEGTGKLSVINSLGFTNILTKPITIENLMSTIRRIYWASPKRITDILKDTDDIIIRTKNDNTVVYINDKYCETFDTTFDKIVNKNMLDLIYPYDVEKVKNHLSFIDINSPIRYITTEHHKRDGLIIYCRWASKAIFNVDNKIIGYQHTGRDITDIHHARLSMEKAEAKYRNLFDNAPDAILLTDINGIIIDCNDSISILFKCVKSDLIDTALFDNSSCLYSDHSIIKSKINEAIKYGESNCNLDILNTNNETINIWAKCKKIIDNKNRVRLLWFLRDISDFYKARLLLENTTLQRDAILSNVPAYISIKDINCKYINANNQFLNFINKTLNDIIGKDENTLRLSDNSEICNQTDSEVLKGNILTNLIMRIKLDDEIKTFSINKSPLYDNLGKIIGIISIGIDITGQLFSEQLIRDTFDSIDDCLFITDKNRKIIKYNNTAANAFKSKLPFVDKTCYEIIFGNTKSCEGCPHCKINKSENYKVEIKFTSELNSKQSNQWNEISHYPLFNHSNENIGTIIHVHDITELKIIEENLRKSIDIQKMIADISKSFVGLPLDQIDNQIKKSLRKIVDILNVDRSYIYIEDEDELFINYTFWRTENTYIPSEVCILKKENIQWLLDKIALGCFLSIEDINSFPKDSEVYNFFNQANCKSGLFLPFIRSDNGKIIGFIGIDMVNSIRTWDEFAISVLNLSAEIFSNAIIRKYKEEQYKDFYTLLRQLFDGISDSLWATDNENKIIFVNKKACETIFHLDYTILINKKLEQFLPYDFVLENETLDNKLRKNQNTIESKVLLTQKDINMWLNITKTPLFDQDGIIVGIINTAKNITEEINELHNLNKQVLELEIITKSRLSKLKENRIKNNIELNEKLQNSINLLANFSKEQVNG